MELLYNSLTLSKLFTIIHLLKAVIQGMHCVAGLG